MNIITLLLCAILLNGVLDTWILFKIATKGVSWKLVWLRDRYGEDRRAYGIGLQAWEPPVGPDRGDWIWEFKFRRDPNLVYIARTVADIRAGKAEIVNGKLVRKA